MTKPCDCCTLAEARPDYPRYRTGCRTCAVRELANGPLYHQGGLDGGNALPYRKRLAAIFGTEWRSGHAMVEAQFRRIREAKAIL